MRPFSPKNYDTPVVHRSRVEVREDGDPVDTWPGTGTELLCHASQSNPQTRYGEAAQETLVKWVLWFSYPAVVEAEIEMLRGDQFSIATAYGPDLVLRAIDNASDYNLLGASIMVPCESII